MTTVINNAPLDTVRGFSQEYPLRTKPVICMANNACSLFGINCKNSNKSIKREARYFISKRSGATTWSRIRSELKKLFPAKHQLTSRHFVHSNDFANAVCQKGTQSSRAAMKGSRELYVWPHVPNGVVLM